MDPKDRKKKREQNVPEEQLSQNPDLSQPHSPPEKSMEISVERMRELVSDPTYPSDEILRDVAAKLLDSFEKH